MMSFFALCDLNKLHSKSSAILLLAFLTLIPLRSKAQNLEWIQQIKDVYDDIDINDVVTDASGNVYIGGSFDDQKTLTVDNSATTEVNFMGSVQTTTHEQMGFLAKLNSSGTLQWIKKFGSPQSTTGYSPLAMATKNGNLYVVGSFEYGGAPGLDFDPDAGTRQIQSVNATDFFVSKYSCSTGAMIWAYVGSGGNGSDLPSGLVIDNSENIYVSGQCNNSSSPNEVDFNIKSPAHNASEIGISSSNQMYLTSYDKDCNFRWRKNITNSVNNSYGTRGLAIDIVNSYVYMAGGISQSGGSNPNFGGASLTVDATTKDAFIAKYDLSGTLQWVKNIASGTSNNVALCIDADWAGNVYVGGYFNGTADFDPSAGSSNLTSAGSYDAFVAKYNSSGAKQWAYKIGSSSFGEMLTSIKTTSAGHIIIGGAMYGAFDANPEGTGGAQNRGATSQRSIYFGQYDADFKYQWAYGLGSGTTNVGNNAATSITIDEINSPYPIYVYGYMSYLSTQDFNPSGAGVFGPSTVPKTATGVTSPSGNQYMGDNGFLAKYSTASIVLPIELTEFTINCETEKLKLNWETASETNNNFFTIEGSKDANRWESIVNISGAGNSLKRNSYNYELADGSFNWKYYRLKQTDFNGKYSYSTIVSANCEELQENDFSIFPNPSQGSFFVSYKNELDVPVSIEVVNVLGESVYKNNNLQQNIDLSSHPDGIYFVHLFLNNKKLVKKILIQK